MNVASILKSFKPSSKQKSGITILFILIIVRLDFNGRGISFSYNNNKVFIKIK